MPAWLDDWLRPPPAITDAFRYSNYIEGVFWIVVGGLSLLAARQRKRPRFGGVLLLIFIVFGVSDWVESTTGAWYFPWWLLAWKAACIVAVAGLLIATKSTATSSPPASTPPP